MNKIELVPLLDASDFSCEVDDEMAINEINTHYHAGFFYLDWEDVEDLPEIKKWLVEEFGEEIMNYRKFAINPT